MNQPIVAEAQSISRVDARTQILRMVEHDQNRLMQLLPDIYQRLSAEIKDELSLDVMQGWFSIPKNKDDPIGGLISEVHFQAVLLTLKDFLQEGCSARLIRANAGQLAPDILASLMQEFDGAMSNGDDSEGGAPLTDIPARFAAYQAWKRANGHGDDKKGMRRSLLDIAATPINLETVPEGDASGNMEASPNSLSTVYSPYPESRRHFLDQPTNMGKYFINLGEARSSILNMVEDNRKRLSQILPDIYRGLPPEIKADLPFDKLRSWFFAVKGGCIARDGVVSKAHFEAVETSMKNFLCPPKKEEVLVPEVVIPACVIEEPDKPTDRTVPLQGLCPRLLDIFSGVGLKVYDVYCGLPKETKARLSFNEVVGWFRGDGAQAQADDLSVFLSTALQKLETMPDAQVMPGRAL